jgi:DNA repair photolyase
MVTLIDRRANYAPELAPALPPGHERGRGARSNMSGRYEKTERYLFDDGWESLDDLPPLRTEVFPEMAKKIITRNDSPDISFDRSINPYRGCEHGCTYCFARPAHAYAGLSPGIDFESKLFAKLNAAERLREELADPNYEPATIALGVNTDAYQPIERTYRITRQILEVLNECNHPTGLITKSALILRDLDILTEMASKNLVKVAISITTLDPKLARAMEPRAATPPKRLHTLETLAKAGIPTTVMVAPVIPALNDSEIESILKAASAAGAESAGYVLLRLPLEVRDIFREWLMKEMPDRASHVMSLVRSMRQGKDYDAAWGRRMKGTGPYAWSIGRRFELACTKLKLNQQKTRLEPAKFRPPVMKGQQLPLF